MLVLTRHPNERIIITASNGERIVVEVVNIRGDKVRVGVDAPLAVEVNREEVQRVIDAKKRGR